MVNREEVEDGSTLERVSIFCEEHYNKWVERDSIFWYICHEECNSSPHIYLCTISWFIRNVVLIEECKRHLIAMEPNKLHMLILH